MALDIAIGIWDMGYGILGAFWSLLTHVVESLPLRRNKRSRKRKKTSMERATILAMVQMEMVTKKKSKRRKQTMKERIW